jgi:hypothetical protein
VDDFGGPELPLDCVDSEFETMWLCGLAGTSGAITAGGAVRTSAGVLAAAERVVAAEGVAAVAAAEPAADVDVRDGLELGAPGSGALAVGAEALGADAAFTFST